MKNRQPCIVEFLDRESDYWESIFLPIGPDTLLRRLQKMLAVVEAPAFRNYATEIRLAPESFVVAFTIGNDIDAENFATLLAVSLGWKEEHGVLVGRVRA